MQINNLLKPSVQQYKDFFDTINSGALYLDNQCRILCNNPAAENILGLPASELLGLSLVDPSWRTITEDGLEIASKTHPVMRALQTGQRISNVVLGLWNRKLNEHVWLSIDTIAQFNPNENQAYAVCVCFDDISQRKKIENRLAAAEKRYRALLFGASDAICIVNLNGYLEETNRSAQRLLGIDRKQSCCLHFTEFHLAEDLPKATKYFADVCERGILEAFETRLVRKDNGALVDIEIHSSLIEADGRVVLQTILIDITDRKKQEQERLAKELSLRHALVREVHHRIKNNLQGIMGVLCQFAQNHPELAGPMNQAITQMKSVAIIHGLQGQACTGDVRLCELTEAIAAEIAHLWQKTVTIDIPEGWTPFSIAESEAVPLALILNELISNAVKYGLGNDPIDISIRQGATLNDVNVTIYNSGRLPDNFDTHRSGLNLATLLMPPTGASLSWQQQGHDVITRLHLSGPIITLDS